MLLQMTQRSRRLGQLIGAFAILLAIREVSAQTDEKAVADFYRGKQIRIVIGSGPGGTYDIYSRLLAKHLGRFVPGNPAMLVQSRAGAGGLIAANTIYKTEPGDGTVIGSFGETFPLRQAMGAPGIQFDSLRYQWIGSAIDTAIACVARTDSPVASFQDVLDSKPFTVGTMAPGSTIYDTPAILNAALNTQMKLVRGFEGVANIVSAAEAMAAATSTGSADWQSPMTWFPSPRQPSVSTTSAILSSSPNGPHSTGTSAAFRQIKQ